jgi:hypothetical protein
VEYTKKKISLWRQRHRWEVDSEMGLNEIKYEDMTGLN